MFRAILSVFNPLVYVLSVCFQTTLIYTIIRHSPKNLSTLKIILLINCFSQSIQSSMAFITQIRYVSNLVPLQLWSYGPCRHFEAFICYSMMHVLQVSYMWRSVFVKCEKSSDEFFDKWMDSFLNNFHEISSSKARCSSKKEYLDCNLCYFCNYFGFSGKLLHSWLKIIFLNYFQDTSMISIKSSDWKLIGHLKKY